MTETQYTATAVVGRPARRLKRLREVRESRAMSQAELAKAAGVSRATVVSLESGRAGAQYATIRNLARVLEVKPADLFGDA